MCDRIYKVEGPDMKEEIQDKFRQYYLEYKNKNQLFPDFPEEQDFLKPTFQFSDLPMAPPDPNKKPGKSKTFR